MSRVERWSPFRKLRAAALAAALAGALVYANAPANDFAYDDVPIVLENEAVHDLGRLPEVVSRPYWAPNEAGRELGLWRPLTSGLLAVQWSLWDGAPAGFHVVNVALHAVVTLLVVLVLGQLIPVAGAFLGGMIFALHPVHVEVVANVVGLAELLGATFFLGACFLFLKRRKALGPRAVAGISLLYALSFLSKESGVTLPAVIFLLDAYDEDPDLGSLGPYLRRRWGLYAGMASAAGLVLLGRFRVLGAVADPLPPLGAEILAEIPRIWTAASSWTHYVRLLFFPADLSADYSPAVIKVALGWTPAAVLGVVLALAFLLMARETWRSYEVAGESARPVSAGIVWFVITILPVANLLFLSGVILAERTLYLPSVGFCLGAGWALGLLFGRRARPALVLATVAFLLLGGRTWTRTPSWENTATLFGALVAEHPEAGRGQWVLADVYRQQGRPDAALRAYRLAAGNVGGSYQLLIEASRMLMEFERWEEAERLARFAWGREPDRGEAPTLVAVSLSRRGLASEALEPATAAVRADSTNATMHHLRAVVLRQAGRLDEAVEARRAAIREGEGGRWQQWSWLGHLYLERGDTAPALAALDSARARVDDARVVCQIDSLAAVWAGSDRDENCKAFAESKAPTRVPTDTTTGDDPP